MTTPLPSASLPSQRFALFLGSLSALVPLAIDMYLPCFDAIAADLAVSPQRVALSLSTFFVGMFAGQIFWGPVSDRYGRRRPLFVGLVTYALASIACACARDAYALIALRLVQSFGGCAAMVLSRAMVRDWYVGKRAAQAASMVMLSQGVAPMLGPSIGAAIASAFGWRAVFLAMAAMGSVLLLLCAWRLPETVRRRAQRLSVRSAARGYRLVLTDRTFLRYALTGSVASAGMFAYITRSPELFLDLLHVSAATYGWCFAAGAIGIMVAGQIARVFIARRGIDGTIRLALRCQLGAVLMVCAGSFAGLRPAILLPGLSLYLSSLGLLWPNISAGALANHPGRAATGAATHGALQWGCACLVSAAAGLLPHGSAVPMAALMLVAHLGGAACYVGLGPAAKA